MAVVKANAYGHGVDAIVRALDDRVEMFGVAHLTEARQLPRSVAPERIYILSPALPAERIEIVKGGYVPTVSSVEEAGAYSALAPTPARVPIHLAIDTGMGRIGVWHEEALAAAQAINQLPGVSIAGIASHLPVADEDDDFTREQLTTFHSLVAALRGLGIAADAHVENSAGLIAFPNFAGDLVRTGLALYGSSPRPEFQSRLRPVLTWKTRVTLVREVGPGRGISYGRTFITRAPMRVATLAVGYADGFQRHLSNRGAEVLIGGQRCPVLGRVTMDQIMVDVTGRQVEPGAEVVLLGQQGNEQILAAEMATRAGTIPWEIFTGIGPRVDRVVSNNLA